MATLKNMIMFPWSLLVLLTLFSSSNIVVSMLPLRLSVHSKKILQEHLKTKALTPLSSEYRTYFYKQTLDHFNYRPQSYRTFQQQYTINDKYWGGAKANAPIFAFLGDEAPMLDEDCGSGFFDENAPRFKALLVCIEHRFYGKSVPGGSFEKAMKDKDIRGYFNSAQALEDYAEILIYIRKKLSAQKSPIIVVGASYGGMLASWFRLKYPHVALGALASSAPILYFDDITPSDGFFSVVTKDFKEASESCYKTIVDSWSEIDRVAATPGGLQYLSQQFHTCEYLNDTMQLKEYLITMYVEAAQYDRPPVNQVCEGIDGAPKGSDILARIYAGLVAAKVNHTCYDMVNTCDIYLQETCDGWGWQTCSEMVIPIGSDGNDTIMFTEPFDLKIFDEFCYSTYGVHPRPHRITSYYGGHDIKLVLQRFASNIIFSNGLRDPFSSGGVTENISDSVVAVTTANGSHCLDLMESSRSDPDWLVKQRQTEVEIIQGWIDKYNSDLGSLNN